MSVTNPPVANDDFVAVATASTDNVLDAVANDQLAANETGSLRLLSVWPAQHGVATLDDNQGIVRYTPQPGFSGEELLTYVVGDSQGGQSLGTMHIRVGVTAFDPAELAPFQPANNLTPATDWSIELETGTGDITVPDGGVVISRQITITHSRRILGNGKTIRFVGDGMIRVNLAATDTFELRDAIVVWERDLDDPGAMQAFELLGGKTILAGNSFFAAVTPQAARYANTVSLRENPPAAFLIVAGDNAHTPSELRIENNRFKNLYWYGAGVLKSAPAQSIATTSFSDNRVEFFHAPLVISGWENGLLSHNDFDRNTHDNVSISSSNGIRVERNVLRFVGGGSQVSAIRLANLSGATVTNNTVFNSEGSGITLWGGVIHTAVDQNFVHASAGSAVVIHSNGSASSDISLFDNFLTRNSGWAVEAHNVAGLTLRENILQHNHTEGDFQHHFENVTGVLDQRNLWDVDFTVEQQENRDMFGTNVLPYSFSLGMDRNKQESHTTPLDTASLAEPTGTPASYESWLQELETGEGDIQLPATGVVISRLVTIRNSRRIVGNGNTLKIMGQGVLKVDIASAGGTFSLVGARIVWERHLDTDTVSDAMHIVRGGMVFQDNQVFALVEPKASIYQDPGSGSAFTRALLGEDPSLAWFFNYDLPKGTTAPLVMERNEFQNSRWYAAGMFYSSNDTRLSVATIRDNTVKYFHGAFFLRGIDQGLVENNRLHRNSFGNLVIYNSPGVVIRKNRVEFPGNGTAGDGATLDNLTGAVVSDNFILDGSCYGIWLLGDVNDTTFKRNVIYGGITSAIQFEELAGLRTFDHISIEDNVLSHNLGWGIAGRGAGSLRITNNVFQGNSSDGWANQHHFSDVESVVAKNNWLGEVLTTAQTSQGARFGVQPPAYHILSVGTDVLVDGSSLIVRGTAANDVFRIFAGDRVEYFVNGDSRSFDPAVIHSVQLEGGGGRDSTTIWTDEMVRAVSLDNGSTHVGAANYSVDTDSEDVSIFGNAPVVVVASGTPEADRLYTSPDYIHLYGPSYDKVVRGFQGSVTYGMGTGDVAIMDDSAGNESFYASSAASCMIGDAFQHVVDGFGYVLARSNMGGTDTAVIDVTGIKQYGVLASGAVAYDSSFYVMAQKFEDVSFQTGVDLTSECYLFEGLIVPPGTIRGQTWGDSNGDGTRSPSELALSGRTVYLDENRNGRLDLDELTAVTDIDGFYKFENVPVGEHAVAQLLPADWISAVPSVDAFVKPSRDTVADLQSHQAVRRENGLVTFSGTIAKDSFAFSVSGSQFVVSFNQIAYQFPSNQATVFRFAGNGGEDSASIAGTAANERVTLRYLGGSMVGSGFEVQVDGATTVDIRGGGGTDIANLSDSTNSDLLVLRGQDADFRGGTTYRGTLSGFAEIYAISSAGGDDRANVYDTTGSDRFLTTSEFAMQTGTGYYNYLRGFKNIYAYAGSGGEDRADLYDSTGNDEMISTPTWSRMAGPSYYRYVRGFDRTYSFATAGGIDTAQLFDSAGNDELVATPAFGRLFGDGFYLLATGFETLRGYATAGGQDKAQLFDSTGNDELVNTPEFSRMYGPNYYLLATGFDSVSSYATSGGDDKADLYGSTGDDELVATPQYSRLMGATFYSYAQGFDRVSVNVTQGGNDRASLFDSAGDDELVSTPQFSRIYGSNYYNYVTGFDRVDSYATAGGNDRAFLFDSAGNDDFYATVATKRMTGDGYYNLTQGFESSTAHASAGGYDRASLGDVRAVDAVLGRSNYLSRSASDNSDWVDGFDVVAAQATPGQTAVADVRDIDFFFQKLGSWK